MTDFPVTATVLGKLDEWLAELSAPLLPLVRVPENEMQAFHWKFSVESPEALQVGKAVRMISGIRAAFALAASGYTTEAVSILRTVSDFAQEIVAIAEALIEGKLSVSQQLLVDQYFAPLPRTAEEFAQRERERYVGREELLKAHARLAAKGEQDVDELLKITRFLNKGFDTYVHGGYLTAMELYRGDTHRFMLNGNEFPRYHCIALRTVAGKAHEVVTALMFMAMSRSLKPLYLRMRESLERLVESDEQARNCR